MTEAMPSLLPDATAAEPEAERRALTRRRILEAALDLADTEGLEAVSMRRLGAQLGVEAMSLYHHFPSKAALLDGLVTLVLTRVPLPAVVSTDWEEMLRTGFGDFRRVMLAHRAVFPLVAGRPMTDPDALVPVARAFTILHAAGFTPRAALSAWCTLLAYVFGYIDCEITGIGEASRGGEMLEVVDRQADPAFASLQLSHRQAGEWDDDAEFDLGLRAVIAGLREQLLGDR
jgi:TetR/AcrR family tetracycline transcriptional repressor